MPLWTPTSRWGPPAWHRDFWGRCSEMPLPSRLVRLLWWEAAGLLSRVQGDLPGPGGAALASPGSSRCPSLAMDAWKPGGFVDTICSPVSLAGKERHVEPQCGLCSPALGAKQSRPQALSQTPLGAHPGSATS